MSEERFINSIKMNSISTWALEEAKARMEARGDSARYIPSTESRIQRP